jgi:hypothetical protein
MPANLRKDRARLHPAEATESKRQIVQLFLGHYPSGNQPTAPFAETKS